MDNGYLAPGETLEDEYDVVKPLLPHEIIGIMDQLLCHEVKIPPIDSIYTEQLIHLGARWHGIKETRFLRRYSLRSILTNCFQHHRKC
jgi:Mak10 subunit, NatC N(alpha)-terminal acetyltransferase